MDWEAEETREDKEEENGEEEEANLESMQSSHFSSARRST